MNQDFYEGIAPTAGINATARRAQFDLRERIKELTCLYGIMQVVIRPDTSLEDILQNIVNLLPAAMQHPEIAVGRINLDQRSYTTTNFHESQLKLAADVVVSGKRRGDVEVAYLEDKPTLESRSFLEEEQSLIEAVANHVALIVKRKEAEGDRAKLQQQLRHADRLATIGQLAAGVAHELNEPLANILGFAQLAKKSLGLPAQTEQDIEKIVVSALHAREVIKKLLTFARQMPPTKTRVNLNKIVEEGLYFLESRCAKQGVELIRSLRPDLPEINADPTQLQQILVNLMVNALHAMANGGRLTVKTLADDSHVSLAVEDTGTGMAEEVKGKLFTPFFTTKDVGQGTGLGLAVVHGIVTSHGGAINVESEVGRGARFEIKLPIIEPLENEDDKYLRQRPHPRR
jgi:signal transduction histidine kinase